jgi:predicted PurR-regulated permease PerM
MVIKLLKVLFKYVLVLLLIVVVVGLLLPQDYRVSKHVEINANTSTIKTLVADFNQWHTWSPWQQVDPTIEFIVNEPGAGVGAHQSWIGKWGYGEMTITSLNNNKMSFNILLNNEHIIEGTLTFSPQENANIVTCYIEGQSTTLLISGYMALVYEYILNNTLELGLNNLKTVAQLSDIQSVANSHDSKNSTSTD